MARTWIGPTRGSILGPVPTVQDKEVSMSEQEKSADEQEKSDKGTINDPLTQTDADAPKQAWQGESEG